MSLKNNRNQFKISNFRFEISDLKFSGLHIPPSAGECAAHGSRLTQTRRQERSASGTYNTADRTPRTTIRHFQFVAVDFRQPQFFKGYRSERGVNRGAGVDQSVSFVRCCIPQSSTECGGSSIGTAFGTSRGKSEIFSIHFISVLTGAQQEGMRSARPSLYQISAGTPLRSSFRAWSVCRSRN